MFEAYYKSPAYGEWCRRVYGKDLKQLGVVTMNELEILYREVELPPNSHILDIGCGAGYISAEIAGHYNARLTAIDADEGTIANAKKIFSNNPEYTFIHGDGSAFPFEAASFDLICFCDSLHFTVTAEKLRELLDKCLVMLKSGGKMAIFRYLSPIDEIPEEFQESAVNYTQVALWGKNNNIPFKATGLTADNKKFFRRALDEILAMEAELRQEIPETYERIKGECLEAEKNGTLDFTEPLTEGRWLYIFTKNNI